ncbi:uncharacterized protein J7T54_007119 [Emericellopsis cladophorae]|uniref:RING-type domain-containing protein n=1 Tax=Emericellopsis cladophorae TaxID=2686198 RepID=A0A9P9Y8M2_9HYPO|nr:uncharacterized protein J7T54_007119 [Emericellopsis cladophorae]KAI6785476.1 hypothetical protein J7T54_007119 [Emericellopsis cladophorae]
MPSLRIRPRGDDSVPPSIRARNVGVIIGCVIGIAILIFLMYVTMRAPSTPNKTDPFPHRRRLFGHAKRSRRGESMLGAPHNERSRYLDTAQFMRFCARRAQHMQRAQKKEHLLTTEELDAVAPLTTLGQASAPTAETIQTSDLGQIRRPPAAALPLGARLDVKPSMRPKLPPVFSLAPIDEKKDTAGRVTVQEVHAPSEGPRSDAFLCSVCLGEAQNEDDIRITPCFHGFHDDCLAEWLTMYQNRCPLCQRCLKPGGKESI